MGLSNSKIKEIRSLHQKKFRNLTRRFIVEGEKLVEEALNSDYNVLEVYKVDEIGVDTMSRISALSTPSPILAVVQERESGATVANEDIDVEHLLNSLEITEDALYLILDDIKDPGNLGTIIRTAEWFGFSGVIASEQTVELYNPKTVQATMGALFRMNILYLPIDKVVKSFIERSVEVYATLLDGDRVGNIKEKIEGKCSAFIFGNESLGISKEIVDLIDSDHRILIPQYDKLGKVKAAEKFRMSESLNVASSVAALSALIRS